MGSFFTELKRRIVFNVGIAHAIVAWIAMQVAGVISQNPGLPNWFSQTVTGLLVLGFPIAIVLALAFELTPEGIKPIRDVQNTESINHLTGRKLDFGIIALLQVVLDNYILVDEPETVSELSISAAVEKPITNSSDDFAFYIQSQAVVSDSSPFNPYVDHLDFHRLLDEGDHLFAVRLCSGEKYERFGPCAPKPSANLPELPTLQIVREHCAQCLSC